MVDETTSSFAVTENDEEELAPVVAVKKGSLPKFYLNVVKRRWLIILIFAISGFVPAFLWSKTDSVIYSGSFEMLVEPVTSAEKLTEPTTLARTGGNVNEDLLSVDYPTILRILKSNNILQQIAEKVNQNYPLYPPAYLLKTFGQDLVVERAQQGKSRFDQTKVISVRYQHENPDLVMSVLETASEQYLRYSQEERERNLESGVKFINEQLPEIRQRIDKLQNRQKELQSQYELISPQVKGDTLFQRNTEFTQEIFNIESQLKELNILAKNLQKDLGLTPAESLIASTLSQDPKRQQLLLDLQAIDSQIAQQSAQLTENHPTILNLQDQKDNISNLLDKETTRVLRENNIDPNVNPRVFAYQDASRLALIQKLIETQNQIDTLSSRYQSLKNSQAQTSSQLAVMPGVIKEYNDLDRQITLDTNILNQLTNQRETLGVEVAQKQIPWQILSPPQIPIDSSGNLTGYSPEPEKKLAFGTGLGAMLGLLIAIALEKRRDIIYETSDLEYAFGLPILGVVELEEKKKDQVTLEEENFFRDSKNVYQKITPIHISLSQVYTNLHFQLPNNHKNRILVTSLHPTDEQAYIAANLAKTATEIDQKVLLIEANTIQPEIHEFFSNNTCSKLKDLLSIPALELSILDKLGKQENVTILSAEDADSEKPLHLSSEVAQNLVDQIAQHYALTIYNSSFFLESFDLSLLAQKTEGIIMVIKLRQTSFSQLKDAIARVQTYDLSFLGFVVIE